MPKLIEWFLENEWKGIKQIGESMRNRLINTFVTNNVEKLTQDNFPAVNSLFKEISNNANLHPAEVIINRNPFANSASANGKAKKITISETSFTDKLDLAGSYAHELGHIKHRNLHKILRLSSIPYRLTLFTTSNLYPVALILGPVGLGFANSLASHTVGFLVAAGTLNMATTRIKEYMADIYSYKQTGVLPSEYLKNDYRHGLIGNVSEVISNTIGHLTSGYPLNVERDMIVKLFAGKPKRNSFVESLNNERLIQNKNNPTPFI